MSCPVDKLPKTVKLVPKGTAKNNYIKFQPISCIYELLCSSRLLLNHLKHTQQYTVPLYLLIGFHFSSKHLCLFLSLSLRNPLLHTSHTTLFADGWPWAAWILSWWAAILLWHNTLHPALDLKPPHTTCSQIYMDNMPPPFPWTAPRLGLKQPIKQNTL